MWWIRPNTVSNARNKTVKKKKTPYDARQMRLPVLTEHERKLAAKARIAGLAEGEDLEAEAAEIEEEEMRRPLRHRIYNGIIGLAMVPFAYVLTVALLHMFGAVRRHGPFYKAHEFVCLIAGCAAWLVIFGTSLAIRGMPLLLKWYVVGHEFMHAWLAGFFFKGRIKEFVAEEEGGYIITDKYNFIIALAPYLWPIYSVPVVAVWGVVGWTPWGLEHAGSFFGVLGFTWMFHVSFTVWMLLKGQSDLLGPGRIFSLALIYIFNVGLLATFVITMAPEFTWANFGKELWAVTMDFYRSVARALAS